MPLAFLRRSWRTARLQHAIWAEVRARPPADALRRALAAASAARRRATAPALAAPAEFEPLEGLRSATALLQDPSPRVRVAPSTHGPRAGAGLFAQRAHADGEHAVFYPGRVFSRIDVAQADSFYDAPRGPDAPEPLEPPAGSSYVLVRAPDGGRVKIDAGELTVGSAGLAELERRCGANAAFGHLANHPPRGRAPNVVEVAVDVAVRERCAGGDLMDAAAARRRGFLGRAAPLHVLPWALAARVPIWWAEAEEEEEKEEGEAAAAAAGRGSEVGIGRRPLRRGILTGALPPITGEEVGEALYFSFGEDEDGGRRARAALLPCVVLAATRAVAAGEELFLDYGLAPWLEDETGAGTGAGAGAAAKGRWPEWYSPVEDAHANQARSLEAVAAEIAEMRPREDEARARAWAGPGSSGEGARPLS
jgi:hypothetical protein